MSNRGTVHTFVCINRSSIPCPSPCISPCPFPVPCPLPCTSPCPRVIGFDRATVVAVPPVAPADEVTAGDDADVEILVLASLLLHASMVVLAPALVASRVGPKSGSRVG